MKRIATRAKYLIILIVFFVFCGTIFFNDYRKNVKKWVTHPSNKNIYTNGELAVSGNIYSSDGVRLVSSNKNGLDYNEDTTIRKSTLHVVGDRKDNIVTGVLSSQKTKLIGYDLLNGVYNAKEKDNDIHLTINAALSATAYKALGDYKGAVGVYNYKTGEILCLASSPSFDVDNLPDLESEKYNGVYINRVSNGLFVPGSIMKLVTSYAAIETISDIYEQQFRCNHGIEINGQWIQCAGNHGTLNFKQALAVSCNATFAEISRQLGPDVLTTYAKKAGILSSYRIDGVDTTRGLLNLQNVSDVDLAWAGIGQYTTMVNPMSFMLFTGAIANGGVVKAPYYIMDSSFHPFGLISKDTRLLSSSSAKELKELMRNNTVVSYGDSNFSGVELCAKSGTAEVEDGKPHSWFVGFSANPDTPIAFVVIVENGAYSSSSALSVSKIVVKEAVALFK